MIDSSTERHLGRLERVLGRKMDVKEEYAALVHGAGRSEDRRHPLVEVVAFRTGTTVWWGVECDLGQLLLDAFR